MKVDAKGAEGVQVPGGYVLGLTGGIACGKSVVGRVLESEGVQVLDTDHLAHEVMAPDGAAFDGVIARFGREMLAADGTIDRRLLGAHVFAEPAARVELNEIVHPHVRRIWHDWARRVKSENGVCAVIIPLLFEVGADREVDRVWCVVASEERMLERLAARGLTAVQGRQRIASQWPLSLKAERADDVLENNGTMEELAEKTRRLWRRILEKEIEKHVR
jgi:dephospho-CoA kinase